MTYAEKLRDPRWQRVRLKIMERDDFACRDCSDKTKNLQVHHCAYVGRDPWNAPESVLLTLCEVCHSKRQVLENEIHLTLGRIMAKLTNTQDETEESFSELEWISIELSEALSYKAGIRIIEGPKQ
jgi:hypothetical protein